MGLRARALLVVEPVIGIGIGRNSPQRLIYIPGPARTATGWRQRGGLCWTEMVEGGRWCEADLEVLVDNAWRTHDGRRGGEGCYDARRGVLHRDPRASPWPFRVTGMSYARARQRPKGLTVS